MPATLHPKINLSPLTHGQTVILAISGGADSVFLLHQLLLSPLNLKIILAHINHNLRGAESTADQNFVEQLAIKHHLKIEISQAKLSGKKGNLEENSRTARYKFFQKIAKKHQADWILTAHHLNDQIETVLFNLTRGTLSNGVNGIQEINPEQKILRPLLNIPKTEILNWLKKNKISFRQDSSNQDLKFSRNRLRLKVIPELQKINSNFLETFQESLQNLQAAQQFLQLAVENWLEKNLLPSKISSQFSFPLENFLAQPPILQKTLLQNLFRQINQKSLTKQQTQEILKTLSQQKSNRRKEFGKNHQIMVKKVVGSQHKRLVVISKALK
ncbi:MAG: tRNA lysidine(34) synthetase TilS [Candidatus Altimarinota bacterium]